MTNPLDLIQRQMDERRKAVDGEENLYIIHEKWLFVK
jgi:hypothetical protein